jgi:ABC-type antimicrobial peptide transport system permease subunit
MFFRPLNQGMGASRVTLIVRAAGDPKEAVAMMRRELHAVDDEIPVYEVGTMDHHVARALAVRRVAATLLGVFGGLALLLASLGLYAVVAFVVSRRSNEMGIRVALGASGSSVFVMVVREMMAVVGIGVAAGLVLSLLATPVLESLLFGIEPNDLLTMASVTGLLALVALGASAAPARRAARVDPLSAMRAD